MKKDFPKAKFTYGDIVSFMCNGLKITGTVEIVDRYGTFGQNEEPSYDIIVENSPHYNGELCLYKHIRQSLIVEHNEYD